ncbi:MAG: bifunctional 4-hydroxy-2-oxoglutarate aldolase/2-dehydro-3-deoxy-phosphogluconate aldolase [Gemmatimonadales bacterium]
MADMSLLLSQFRIVPVIVLDDPDDAAGLANALMDGGLPCAEITLRTPGAIEAIRRMAGERPEMFIGAGTVLNEKQAEQAQEAGAQFIVSPGFSGGVVNYCLENGLPVFPGVCTPTEIIAALDAGVTALKFFPAEAMGGVTTLKAVSAPFGDVRFIPTGGVNERNVCDYLAVPNVIACGGSWMAPSAWIAANHFDRITQTVREAVVLVAQAKPESTQ